MLKRLSTFVPFAAIALMVVLLPGCGSSRDSDSVTPSNELGSDIETGVSYTGAATCIECHEGKSWSADEVSSYLAGKHVVHSDHIDQETAQAEGCYECHDPIGDGPMLEAWLNTADVPAAGLAAVTCEACHGAGGEHYGLGPIPNPQPGADICGQCHSTLPESHLPHHPDADTIYERYAASAHAGSAGPGYSEYSTDENLQNGHMTDHLPFGHNCIKCHTHEGAIKYLEVDDADGIAAIDDGAGNTYTSIQCKTCHDPHEAGKLLEPAVHEEHPIYAEDGVTLIGLENITVSSAQFNTCMNCHDHEGYHLTRNTAWSMLETHGDKTSVLVVSDELEGGEGHFDVTELTNRDGDLDIASSLGISNFTYEYTNDIEGYVIDETSEDSCSACHDIHGPKNEINEQWAKSGHAAEIGLVKEELGPDAVITLHDEDERHSVVAFTEQNWGFGADREECQRCHTTTGASNYLGNEVDYNSASNDFSHLDPVYDDATGEFLSSKVEFLSCEACHTSATTGELRITDTDITLDYTYGGEEIVLAGVNESTTCLTCHGGWGNNDSLRQITDENRDFHGVLHHGPAGAILFAEQTHPAYEFDGQVYSKGNLHATLGTTDASGNEVVAGTGTAGPCVTCHMSSDNNHSNIVAENLDVCNTCHEISEARLTELNEQRVQTQALIRDYINKTVPLNADGVSTGIKGVALPEYPLEYYRAAMNWWVVFDDRGAEAHNPAYVKQVAFDTIDYLDDGVLNGTINIDPATWPLALEWLNGTATGMITRP